jgi:hypothetical protein
MSARTSIIHIEMLAFAAIGWPAADAIQLDWKAGQADE